MASPSTSLSTITSIRSFFQHQTRLNSVNTLLSFTTAYNQKKLSEENKLIRIDLEQGRTMLLSVQGKVSEHATQIAMMEQDVVELQDTAERQQEEMKEQKNRIYLQENKVDALKEKVVQHQNQLEMVLLDLDERLRGQNEQLLMQEQQLVLITKSRIRTDFVIDLVTITTSYIVANSVLVKYPLSLLLSLMNKGRFKSFISVLTRLLIAYSIFSKFRSVLTSYGFHSNMGTLADYTSIFSATVDEWISNIRNYFEVDDNSKLRIRTS